MSNILTQNWLISRRHFLRGVGATVALPLLDCMIPARARAAVATKPRRSVFIYIPNGVNVLTWQITKAGRDFAFSGPMASLEKHRAHVTPISGLHHPGGIGGGHIVDKMWLTAARVKNEGGPFRNTVSADQLMAEANAPHTRFASLELSVGRGNNSLAWSRDGVPLPAEDSPKVVFDRLFGIEKGGIAQQRRRLQSDRGVLDSVLDDARSLKKRVGTDDRTKLDEYFEAVRSVEVRTERADTWLDVPKPKVEPADAARVGRNVPKSEAGDYYRTMYDLMVLALRTDMTRVATFMSGTEAQGLALPEIGVPQTRHELSHHNGDPVQMGRLTSADTFLVEQFSYFLDQLHATRDGDAPLLDRTMVLFGSGMSYGHSHGNANLPLVLAGGSALGLKHGQHIDYNLPKLGGAYEITAAKHYSTCSRPLDDNARMTNLLLTMLQMMEINAEKFADSLGPVSELV
ncbi:MAG: DUF1552 domain-containing protein [Prosthecobacter sp.]|uniref:DUF1552 domain-containing protein n=1 Tax=Prosthecobacter sp. TaxID=1965333 RepID=UPI0039015A05